MPAKTSAKTPTKTKSKLKRGDRVRVTSGKHKGLEGRVLEVRPTQSRVVIEGVNVIRKAQRPTQDNPRGGFSEREAPIHVSNVRILDPKTGEPSRVGTRTVEGRRVRVSVKSGAQLDK